MIYVTRDNTMIFKCENIGRRYSSLIFALIVHYLIMKLMTQNVYAYPHQSYQNERNNVQIPDILSKISLEEDIEDDELSNSEKRFKRDTSSYEDIDTSSVYNKPRNQRKDSSSKRERVKMNGGIVFPGEMRQVPICKGSTYCEEVESYPENVVNEAIQRNQSLKYLAGIDIIYDIAQRIDVTDDVPLCVSHEQVIFPQSAENKNNEWKFIANQENFKQGVRIEKCSKESDSCSVIGGLAEGYKTSCKQKYVYRELASILSDGSVVPDTFRFPSSCCCHVSFNGNPLTRMGGNRS